MIIVLHNSGHMAERAVVRPSWLIFTPTQLDQVVIMYTGIKYFKSILARFGFHVSKLGASFG